MLGRQQNGYILNGLSILLPRDFVPYKSQTSMSIVPCGATMDKGIEGKVFTMQQRNYSRDLYLVEKDTVMNAHVQAIREEKEDIGFYARVPRIVRTGYKELSHAEKWLYTCLRDLCGEAGECWRSLRALAKETGISIASLSSMIPHLAQVGLIDAMKKSTWFIKIKNIWQANKEYCSKNEHSASGCSENEQGVQKMNADCSENEQGCSNFVTKEDISKKIESEEDNTKKDISSTGVDDAIARKYKEGLLPRNSPLTEWLQDISLLDDAFLAEMEQLLDRNQPPKISTPVIHSVDNDTPSHIVQATRKEAAPPLEQPHLITTKAALQAISATSDGDLDQSTSPPTRETKAKGKSKNGGLTLQGQHILDEYQQFKGRKSTPGKATIEAANGLVDLIASDEEFTAVLTEIRDDKFLNDHNVARDLDFVYRKYEQYRDIVEQKQTKKPSAQDNGVRLIGGK